MEIKKHEARELFIGSYRVILLIEKYFKKYFKNNGKSGKIYIFFQLCL
jgi:hypothetical protein